MEAQLTHRDGPEGAIIRKTRHLYEAGRAQGIDTDALVVEEPLEIRLGNLPLAVLMRTPGEDIDLVTGFCLTELIVPDPSGLSRVVHCSDEGARGNVVRVLLASHVNIDPARFQRNLYSTSSCGICGKRSIDRAMEEAPPLRDDTKYNSALLARLPDLLLGKQPLFRQTGALHAAGLFDDAGKLLFVREDIGRHNAVDKVVGAAARAGVSTGATCLVVSGRASYEVVQKALAARIGCVVAVGGVSSLAAGLALRAEMVLSGFARSGRLSIYSGAERVR